MHGLTLIRISNYILYKSDLSIPKVDMHSRWSLGIGQVISSYTLLGLWLLIHAAIEVNPY